MDETMNEDSSFMILQHIKGAGSDYHREIDEARDSESPSDSNSAAIHIPENETAKQSKKKKGSPRKLIRSKAKQSSVWNHFTQKKLKRMRLQYLSKRVRE